MTRKQLQNEILKQFKNRLKATYGTWTDMYKLTCKFYDEFCAGDLMKLNFENEFTTITIIYDCCLNVSVLVTGCSTLTAIIRVFIDVAEETVNYIHWYMSKDKIYEITFK